MFIKFLACIIVQAILVDPIYEVNPLTALVDLATKLLLHPLSRLVQGFIQDLVIEADGQLSFGY